MLRDRALSNPIQNVSNPDFYSNEWMNPDQTIQDDADDISLTPDRVETLSRFKIFMLNISFFGVNQLFLVLSVEVVPAQVEKMVGSAAKGTTLGAIVAGGAVLTFIAGPLIGMASDRLNTRFGRRRPIMIVGAITSILALFGMAACAPEVYIKNTAAVGNITGDGGICVADLVARRCSKARNETFIIPRESFTKLYEYVLPERPDDAYDAVSDNNKRSGNLGLFTPLYLIAIVGYVCCITPYQALVADKSHPDQRGLNSGIMGGMVLIGCICGAGLGVFLEALGVFFIYLISLSIMLLSIFMTCIFIPEVPYFASTSEPLRYKDVIFGFWSPLKKHDFFWVFLTRFLMQQGLSTVVGFFEYWLGDTINLPYCWNAARGVSVLLVPMFIAAAISAVFCGILSDKIGRRKPFVIAASLLMAAVAGVMSYLRGTYAFYAAIGCTLVFGISLGGYQAVDFALLMDVLPAEKDNSRDIAVWQQALVLPQALAVPVGGIIIDYLESANCKIGLGYIVLMIVTSVYFLLGGMFVTFIRNTR